MADENAVRQRCDWPVGSDELLRYHDQEWGRPTTDANRLFEKICLEGFQSGLSWLTILRKRDRFREVFEQFDIERVAAFGHRDVRRLLGDTGIIRHRGKIEATINNAQRAIELIEAEGPLVDWIWSWAVPSEPPTASIPSKTPRSAALARELKGRGWKFFGPTTAYAFMQSEGLTNDHGAECFARAECEHERSVFLAGRELRQVE
ncbi:MAG: DNA-3-methyladenine glycosylase I [Acidimicrobiales bacterium]|nr:DNA-3-methyladenine glycosylase I [Acidimicrobiales bacterium]